MLSLIFILVSIADIISLSTSLSSSRERKTNSNLNRKESSSITSIDNKKHFLFQRGAVMDNNGGKTRQNRITIESQPNTLESLFSSTIITLPPIAMRLSLSNFLPDLHTNSLQDDLEDLATIHLTNYYNSYKIEEIGFESSFNQFSLDVLIKNENVSERNYLQRRKSNRSLKSENNPEPVSLVNAELNGYALFDKNITWNERKIIEDLPTQAFIGLKHAEFLREMQDSSNEALSSVVQISISSQSKRGSPIGAATFRKSSSNDIDRNMVLSFVFGCFFVGIMVGAFVVHKFSYVFERQDDETEVTSNGSFNEQTRKRGEYAQIEMTSSTFMDRFFSKDRKPTHSILIDESHNDNKNENHSLNNEVSPKKSSKSGKSRARKKKGKKRNRTIGHDMSFLTSIEEESDRDLYIDFVDDIVTDQMKRKGSLFPTLHDRLSNTKTGRFFRSSSIERDYNDSYTPTKCKVPHESINHMDNGVNTFIPSDITNPISNTSIKDGINENSDVGSLESYVEEY